MSSWDQRTSSFSGGSLSILRTSVKFLKNPFQSFFELKTILGLRLIFNIIVYYTAKKRLPEFSGFCGRSFPIENSQRIIKLLPRGQELPASFDKDWRDIGVTRLTPSPIHIIVTPSQQDVKKNIKIDRMSAALKI